MSRAKLLKVRVLRGSQEVKEIERPVRIIDGITLVKYRRQLWPLLEGDIIRIDGHPYSSDDGPEPADEYAPEAVEDKSGANVIRDADARRVGTFVDFEIKAPKADSWDDKQLEIIRSAPHARLVVDAGPGTGKTAVACKRVAELIDTFRVTAGNIWLISFTRTAVKEIGNRISQYLQDPRDLFAVRMATIDSHAWAIHSGFDTTASLSGDYESNIEKVTELVRKHNGVFEYLSSVEHILIDEAQDIVGPRADLILAILEQLPEDCGITVLADEAQAIYGFAEENGGSVTGGASLLERLRSHPKLRFEQKQLANIYRTDDKVLRKLFTEVRARVLAPEAQSGESQLERVTEMVRGLADHEPAVIDELAKNDPALSKTFVLFRRRVDALRAAAFWGIHPHRLRIGGMPVLIEPWLGALLWDCTERRLDRSSFNSRWSDTIEGGQLSALSRNAAWEHLIRVGGESADIVSLALLRSKLGRKSPPSEFTKQDFGLGGPVFGTIHGCKGREADTVLLMLPELSRTNKNDAEEARVVFVGATRAKLELRVGSGFRFAKARRETGSKRVYSQKHGKLQAQVEFGREGDFTLEGVATQRLFASAGEVVKSHKWLIDNHERIVSAGAEPVREKDWQYLVAPAGGPPLCYGSPDINGDLFNIGKEIREEMGWRGRLRPNGRLCHLKVFGASTLVVHPDDPRRSLLHEPWATSGFVLAPVVQGFDTVYFKNY